MTLGKQNVKHNHLSHLYAHTATCTVKDEKWYIWKVGHKKEILWLITEVFETYLFSSTDIITVSFLAHKLAHTNFVITNVLLETKQIHQINKQLEESSRPNLKAAGLVPVIISDQFIWKALSP